MIYTTLDAAALPDETIVGDLPGWTQTPAYASTTIANGEVLLNGSTCLYDIGSPVIRGFARMDASRATIAALLVIDRDNCFCVQYSLNNGNPVLVANGTIFVAGNPVASANIYVVFNTASGVGSDAILGWLVDGASIILTINNRAVSAYLNEGSASTIPGQWPQDGAGAYLPGRDIPAALQGVTKAGFVAFGSPAPSYFQLRDNNDLLLIQSVVASRSDDTHQKLTVSGVVQGLAGATSVLVEAAEVSHAAPIVSGAFSTVIDPIPNGAENAALAIHGSAVGTSASDTTTYVYFVKPTVVVADRRPAVNLYTGRFYGCQIYRDLTKHFWFTAPNGVGMRPNWLPAASANDLLIYDYASLGYSPRGVPLQWYPGSDQINILLLQKIDSSFVGKVSLLRLAPGLDWEIANTAAGSLDVLEKNLGTGINRIRINVSNLHGAADPELILRKTAGLPNYGLPTTEWADQLSWRVEGDTSPYMLSDVLVSDVRNMAVTAVRTMNPMEWPEEADIKSPVQVPSTWFTADSRTKPSDATYTRQAANEFPFEALVEMAERCGLMQLWVTMPRGVNPSYVRSLVQIFKASSILRARGAKLALESGNEPWNQSYPFWYPSIVRGYQRGWGNPTAVFGADAGLYPDGVLPASWDGDIAYGAGAACIYAGNLYAATTSTSHPATPFGEPEPQRGNYPSDQACNAAEAQWNTDRVNYYYPYSPLSGNGEWVLTQDLEYALYRHNKSQALAIIAAATEEFGAEADRLEICYNLAIFGFSQKVRDIYLDWGGAPACRCNFTFSPYLPQRFDYSRPYTSDSGTPSSVINAAPGAERQAAWTAAYKLDVPVMIDVMLGNARFLADGAAAGGLTNCYPGVYESGTTISFQGYPNQAADGAFNADFLAWFEDRDGCGAVLYDFQYSELREIGGFACHFTLADNYTGLKAAGPSPIYYGDWGAQDGPDDQACGRYRGVRDAHLESGATIFPGLDPISFRRPRQQPRIRYGF